MDDKIITPQEAAEAPERAQATIERINTQNSETGYYSAQEGVSSR